jgi:hypothetical protein
VLPAGFIKPQTKLKRIELKTGRDYRQRLKFLRADVCHSQGELEPTLGLLERAAGARIETVNQHHASQVCNPTRALCNSNPHPLLVQVKELTLLISYQEGFGILYTSKQPCHEPIQGVLRSLWTV